MGVHYVVPAAGAGGEATEGCRFWGVKKVEIAPVVPVSLHSQDSCEQAQHSNGEHNL